MLGRSVEPNCMLFLDGNERYLARREICHLLGHSICVTSGSISSMGDPQKCWSVFLERSQSVGRVRASEPFKTATAELI